ncbi:quinohemoprotein amine dehydrogenase subunit beta [Amphritea sp. 1_MG-2023]|uniref:quinohemoprotein amine dehydrogenase subunit beta n=1 Tax=Amphritea sp. 1_MG-2023 TaxID=3062670 RepID=UPI0026E40707|nr:quinohemoprotein amine dehydrogenase subunit beta [Amphritea sp. 1_MG-2023]MDO6561874.1 quinohemoprotein amine dehydrogenase subunit beta [Amphritea sp. 1_MG-2023]
MKLTQKIKAAALMGIAGSVALISGCAMSPSADLNGMKGGGHEYLLTVTRPNQLHVIDTETNKVIRSCDVPGIFGQGTVEPSPDGRIAYVGTNKWEDVVGFDITNCDIVFSAKQSYSNVTVKSFVSLAVSRDGKELYTVQNPTRKLNDRYEVMQPQLAVYDTSAGLNAKPLRTFPVDRQITKIMAMDSGEVILAGNDVQAINPENGDVRVLTLLQNWNRGDTWTQPDAFAMHTLGEQADEFILPYFTIKWNGDPGEMEKAEFWWGMSRVDLKTGEVEAGEILPFEFIVFNFITDPTDSNILYGAFNTLSKHDISEKKTLAVHNMEHTYYNLNMTQNRTIYVGGTSSDISIHDPDTLEKIGSIKLPGDQSTAAMRIAFLK